MLSSAFIPVSANNNIVRGWLCVLLFSSMAAAAALLAGSCAAHPSFSTEDPLQDAIATLANEVAVIRDLRGPFHLDWQNESSLATTQSVALQSQFSARLAALRGLITEDVTAPSLRVTLRETAAQLVIVARVPAADGEQVRLVQVSRAAFAAQDAAAPAPYLQKQLVWKQREPILDALEHATVSGNVLLVLGRETLWVYGSLSEQPALQTVAHIPGAVHASRALAGRIRFANEEDSRFELELPGKICSGSLADKIALDCAPAEPRKTGASKSRFFQGADDSTKLLAPCDHHEWILSADDGDWSKPDHLSLRDSQNAASDRTTVLETPGPVLALASGPEAASSIAVVLNVSTGEYEIHRLALACRN
ncbi:MAG TPA: hypothetical protein VOA78_07675 [Candidatus Dormibacteraeota bacterium]|nr:hypothetical protein [Candidatus Dormibacteraeota bacterium]